MANDQHQQQPSKSGVSGATQSRAEHAAEIQQSATNAYSTTRATPHDHQRQIRDHQQSVNSLEHDHGSGVANIAKSSSRDPFTDVPDVGWPLMSVIVLGTMLGVGILTLPANFVRLGWVPAVVLLVLFAAANVYCGVLYSRYVTETFCLQQ